jgi:hypothetical protein
VDMSSFAFGRQAISGVEVYLLQSECYLIVYVIETLV